MADAEKAIAFVLSNEGGFIDNPSDSGGATNFGLSLRFLRELSTEKLRQYGIFTLPAHLSVADIQELRPEQAELIYKCEFWDLAPYEKIENQHVANYVFDMAVNHGETQAIKILQRAIWAVNTEKDFPPDDGILGHITLSFTKYYDQEHLGIALAAERAGFMRFLCVINPKNKEFLDGWLNRCYRI